MISADFKRGAAAAADIAAQYATTHPFRLDDCVLGKLNLSNRKPRRNKHQVQNPQEAWKAGFAVALAEMHRRLLGGADSTGVCEVASNAGITLNGAKRAGVDSYDLRELKKAGVK